MDSTENGTNNATKFDPKSHYTRLYISNLPKYLTDARLQTLLSQYGTVTSCAIKRTPQGKSREFGFVGFEKHEDAKKALKALNGTYIDTRRIDVKKALPRGDNDLHAKAWSTWTKGDESYKKQKERQKSASENETGKIKKIRAEFYDAYDVKKQGETDAEFREYMGLKNNKKAWKNDLFENDEMEGKVVKKGAPKRQHADDSSGDDAGMSDSSDDEGTTAAPRSSTDRKRKTSPAPASATTTEKKRIAKMSDDEFLNMISQNGAKDAASSDSDDESTDRRGKKIRKADVLDTGRLFLRNIGYTWTEEDIHTFFSGHGELTAVHLPIDPKTKMGVGYAFATFMFPEKAQEAMHALDGSSYKGRVVQIHPAENPRQVDLQDIMSRDDLSYKQKLLAKRKAEKDNKVTWNALYMRGDTIAESVAQEMGVNKRQFLGDASHTDRMAVRMAKAEADIIRQTKETLSGHGVDFSVLNDPDALKTRSKNAILIKNLPPNTQSEEIEELFAQYGQLEKVVLPPSRTIALVKFYHNNEAKVAFNKNSFRKFKHVPLFLEWAPQAMADSATKKKKLKEAAANEKKNEDSTTAAPSVKVIEAPQETNAENATLFVSNISFQTTEDDLRELFSTCGEIVNLRLLKSKGSTGRHRGSGFISFSNLKDAARAHEKLQNYIIDQHALVVRYSNLSRADTPAESKKEKVAVVDGKTLTFKKIVVKNLAFQATRKEIYQLFSQFGKIDNVRLPEKVAGGHRGFAFVEFVSAEECHNAYEALKHAHLYGRHLVLEYAADDHSVETARKRARESMAVNDASEERERKRQRKEITIG